MAPLGWHLRARAMQPRFFGYVAAVESVERIVARLTRRLVQMADRPYLVVGHSLGGVLLRLAVARLPPGVRPPEEIVLVGSPHGAPRLAQRLGSWSLYRLLNGEAGQLLADPVRMATVPRPAVPCTVVVGTRGIPRRWCPFGDEPNDGVVAVSEVVLGGDEETLVLARGHTFLMNAREVREHIHDVVLSASAEASEQRTMTGGSRAAAGG